MAKSTVTAKETTSTFLNFFESPMILQSNFISMFLPLANCEANLTKKSSIKIKMKDAYKEF